MEDKIIGGSYDPNDDDEEEERALYDELSAATPTGDVFSLDDLAFRDRVLDSSFYKKAGAGYHHNNRGRDSRRERHPDSRRRYLERLEGRSRYPYSPSGAAMDSQDGDYGDTYALAGRRAIGRSQVAPIEEEEGMMPIGYHHRSNNGRRHYRGGAHGHHRLDRYHRDGWHKMSGASAIAESAGYGSQVYYDPFDRHPVEEISEGIYNGDVPAAYQTIRFPFRMETTLAEAASLKSGHEVAVPLTFGNSQLARTIAQSGAFLGDIAVNGLRHNAPVSMAVRCECTPSGSVVPGVNLRAPNMALSAATHPVHEVISKRASAPISFKVRDVQPIRNTWLSDPKYQGRWSIDNIHKGIHPIGDSSKVSLQAGHPIADLLYERGSLGEQDVLDDNMAVIEGDIVDAALGEIKSEEHGNSLFRNAQNLRLVFHRAYGKADKHIGKPAMTDPTELLDNITTSGADSHKSMTERRLNQPFVIEGEWEVSFGKPLKLEEEEVSHSAADVEEAEAFAREEQQQQLEAVMGGYADASEDLIPYQGAADQEALYMHNQQQDAMRGID
jgi:hypothetical protein